MKFPICVGALLFFGITALVSAIIGNDTITFVGLIGTVVSLILGLWSLKIK
jgi:hypothetical protein